MKAFASRKAAWTALILKEFLNQKGAKNLHFEPNGSVTFSFGGVLWHDFEPVPRPDPVPRTVEVRISTTQPQIVRNDQYDAECGVYGTFVEGYDQWGPVPLPPREPDPKPQRGSGSGSGPDLRKICNQLVRLKAR